MVGKSRVFNSTLEHVFSADSAHGRGWENIMDVADTLKHGKHAEVFLSLKGYCHGIIVEV